MQSDKPIGFKAKLWISRDIIPAIRKHGLYTPEGMSVHILSIRMYT
ncbi:hypothetical protein [Desulfonatronum parangueonense]